MMMEFIGTVDTNDGDYATEVSTISAQDLDKLRPLIAAIKQFEPYEVEYNCEWSKDEAGNPVVKKRTFTSNFCIGECVHQDMGEKTAYEIYNQFDAQLIRELIGMLPYCEYGYHTLVSITVSPLVEKEILL